MTDVITILILAFAICIFGPFIYFIVNRLGIKFGLIYRSPSSPALHSPILVYGAGALGTQLVELTQKGDIYKTGIHFKDIDIIGFIDDAPDKQGEKISGLSVKGPSDDLDNIFTKEKISAVVIAIRDIDNSRLKNIRKACNKHGVRCLRYTPGFIDLN